MRHNEKCFLSVRARRSAKEDIRPPRHCRGNLWSENISSCNVCCGLIPTKGGQGTDAPGGRKFPQGGRRNMGKGGKVSGCHGTAWWPLKTGKQCQDGILIEQNNVLSLCRPDRRQKAKSVCHFGPLRTRLSCFCAAPCGLTENRFGCKRNFILPDGGEKTIACLMASFKLLKLYVLFSCGTGIREILHSCGEYV